ncbi:MAG: hypothetical protein NWF04_02550 [Candidatus Bathyarchaeota archaeon]|nr:hypothetical protein [Candidatus Bathyarchaeota archaeon]
MSQTLIVKNPQTQQTTQTQRRLSTGMRSLNDLFPGFAIGDFAVVYGSSAVSVASFASILCVRAQLPTQLGGLNSNVVFIDAANAFNQNQISRRAQLSHLNPKKALSKIVLSKAIDAYHLTQTIMEHLHTMVNQVNAKLVVVSNIAELFLSHDVPKEEAHYAFAQITAYLQDFARKNHVTVITTFPPSPDKDQNRQLRQLAAEQANVVINLSETTYDRDFILEKHPQFMLGSAEFCFNTVNLTDFM